jgi:hypothetical protein
MTLLRRSFLNFLQSVTTHPSGDVTPADSHLSDLGIRRPTEPDAAQRVGTNVLTPGVPEVTNKFSPKQAKKQADVSHPGMMGDGTEEQSLDERGNPTARIKKDELDATFGKQNSKKPT